MQSQDSHRSRGRRTLQACGTCRRRKTKCDGVRPRCQHCSAKNIPCIWPGLEQDAGPATQELHVESSPAGSLVESNYTQPTIQSVGQISSVLPSKPAIKRCLELFFERHFACDFCSFDYKIDLEDKYQDKPFLIICILALCGRYLSPEESRKYLGSKSGEEVSCHFASIGRNMAKARSDEPSVQNIQGNLVLALSELLANSGSSHWMLAGTAIRAAQIMRLNKEYHQHHSLKDQEIRRRTFWACATIDKLLAYVLTKPVTIPSINIGIALPSTDLSLAYQETTRGLTLDTIGSFPGYPSEIGLAPYFIKTISLWSSMADLNVCNWRFLDKFPPTSAASQFFKRKLALDNWVQSFPASLIWTEDNYRIHCGLGQGVVFAAMHCLVRSGFCVANQCYLPQLDGSSILLDALDSAGWSLLHRESTIISVCLSNAISLGKILSTLVEIEVETKSSFQSPWIAASMLSVANTFLWIKYASDPEFTNEDLRAQATVYFDLIMSLFSSWKSNWKAAREWYAMLDAMHLVYRAAYLGESGETAIETAASSDDDDATAGFRPQPGDGYPCGLAIPNLHASLRLITSDSTAKPKVLHHIWMRIASGWPQELVTDFTAGLGSNGLFNNSPPPQIT